MRYPTKLHVLCLVSAFFALSASAWKPSGLPPVDGENGYLCPRSFLSEADGLRVLSDLQQAFPDAESWQQFVAHARLRLLQGLGLDPLPDRAPLNVVIHSFREMEGYSVENIAIETLPGFWLTGNLYRPVGPSAPFAAVIHPHGHSADVDGEAGWSEHGRFKADVQYRAAALAKMGAVSLTMDMVGYGDQILLTGADSHRLPESMALQFWNGLRALDYLSELPEVDPSRIGVTSYSGGATQGFILAALDERISAQVSVAMVSAHFFGGCPCESGMPIHRSEDHFLSNPMIAALMAPRSLLLISVGADWTSNSVEVEYPFIRERYRVLDAEERVAHLHLPTEGHDYGFSKRQAMYAFMAEALDLDKGVMIDGEGEWSESSITIEDPRQMRVFNARHPVPEGVLENPSIAYARLKNSTLLP